MEKRGVLAIVLAGGYGTRLQVDIQNDNSGKYQHLFGLSKALLPLKTENKTILDIWLDKEFFNVTDKIVVITNNSHFHQFENWAKGRNFPKENILNDGTNNNEERLGAVLTLKKALTSEISENYLQNFRNEKRSEFILFVAGDTLLKSTVDILERMVETLENAPEDIAGVVLGYKEEAENLRSRGIAELDANNNIINFLEKPSPSQTESRTAVPPVYLYRSQTLLLEHINLFLEENAEKSLEERDAPGKLVGYLSNQKNIKFRLIPITGRHDVGSLMDYRLCSKAISKNAYARLGMMGNPSDNCNGRVIASTISNFSATVRIEPLRKQSSIIRIKDNPLYDTLEYSDINSIPSLYNGILRLIRAVLSTFSRFCKLNNISLHKKGFEISYDTNIPRQVGLSGSSALICAAFRALEVWYNIKFPNYQMPYLIWHVENKELGIASGLMDRVIQWHEGFRYLDFSLDLPQTISPLPPFPSDDYILPTPIPKLLSTGIPYHMECLKSYIKNLPPLGLYYSTAQASESGSVHSNVRQRFLAGDEEVRKLMKDLANIASSAVLALKENEPAIFAKLMSENFAIRHYLYGDDVIGEENLRCIRELHSAGFGAKFAGSGGAIIAAPYHPDLPFVFPTISGYNFVRPNIITN